LYYGIGLHQKQLLNANSIEKQILAQTGLPVDPNGDEFMRAAYPDGVEDDDLPEEYSPDEDWKDLFFDKWREYVVRFTTRFKFDLH